MSLSTVFAGLNLLAVLAAGIVHMATGLVWYQPKIFGNAWSAMTGKDLNPAKPLLVAGFIGHMIIALVLAALIRLAGAASAFDGFLVGILVWIGFVVTLEIGELIWEKIPFRLFLIRIGEHFVALGLAGVILALWR
jgi:hypothetical protein